MIIQCDSGHHNTDLIACARYRIYDEAVRAKSKNRIQNRGSGITHVLFMIRLPPQEVKSQFVGFLGDPWISVHIDDLRQTSESTVIPEQAINAKLSELFIGKMDDDNENLQDNPEDTTPSKLEPSDQIAIGDGQKQGDELSTSRDIDEIGNNEGEEVSEKHPDQTENSSEESAEKHPDQTENSSEESTEKHPPTVPSEPFVSMKPASKVAATNQLAFYPQHRRLNGCIQASVSALKDPERDRSRQRIQKLTSVIPKEPEDTLG